MRFLVLLLLAGCATQPIEDREYRYALTYEKWQVCRAAYRKSNAVWHSTFHNQEGRPGWRPKRVEMEIDMGRNMGCRRVLQRLGYE